MRVVPPYYRLEDVQKIKHFQSLGNLFGVCTGRSYKGIEIFNPHQMRITILYSMFRSKNIR